MRPARQRDDAAVAAQPARARGLGGKRLSMVSPGRSTPRTPRRPASPPKPRRSARRRRRNSRRTPPPGLRRRIRRARSGRARLGVAHVAQRPAAHPDQPVGAVPGEAPPQRGPALLGETPDFVEALLQPEPGNAGAPDLAPEGIARKTHRGLFADEEAFELAQRISDIARQPLADPAPRGDRSPRKRAARSADPSRHSGS